MFLEKTVSGETMRKPARGRERRAYHQALDSAWRSYLFGDEAAGAMNSFDREVARAFGKNSPDDLVREKKNRETGARLGLMASSAGEIVKLVDAALLNGELDEGEKPQEAPPVEAPALPPGAGPEIPENAEEEDPLLREVEKDPDFDHNAYEIFGRP